MDLSAEILAPLEIIEAALRDALQRARVTPRLRGAMEYAVLGAGKRVRPLLAWHCCVAMGGKGEDALPACVGVELVHCFSLVHDDLPAIDNDDLRRGKPTLHKAFGECMAILAGDALLTLAGDLVGTAHATLHGATLAMIAGQVADTLQDFPPDVQTPEARLGFVHTHKTGALLHAACMMGAACAPHREYMSAIDCYAREVGVLFQAVDDLLDVTQPAHHVGKRTGKDQGAGKLTYPAVYGIEATRARIAAHHRSAINALTPLGARAAALREIAGFVAMRTK